MNNKIKSFIVLGAILTSLSSYGASFTTNLTGLVTSTLLATNVTVSSIKITTTTLPTGTNASVKFYDQKGNTNTYAFGAYTTRVTVSTNITQVFTNTVGLTQTNIYPGQFTYSSTVASSTNTLPADPTFIVTANSSETKVGNWLFVRGLTVQNATDTTNVTVTVEYEQQY